MADIKLKLSKELGLSEDEIIVHSICAGSVKVEYSVENKINTHKYFKFFNLSPDDFDPRGNFDFTSCGEIQERAGFPYYQPHGSKRYGLKVIGQYDGGNDNWLSMDSGVKGMWAVAYHGIRSPTTSVGTNKMVLHSIMEGRSQGTMLREGPAQAFSGNVCARTNVTVGNGIYCTPNVEQALGYTSPLNIGGQQYRIVMQMRVDPKKIKIPNGCNYYYVLNESKYLRPYGILLFKENYAKNTSLPSYNKLFSYNDFK